MEKFLKIYFWQIISVILNFAALFIVTPYLSSQPSIFGIYSIVTALFLFISYADLGFISAGMKYASECFAQKDIRQEIRIIGFVGFVFAVFVFINATIIALLSLNPHILVHSLNNPVEVKIASNLLLTLAVFSPVFVVQRILQIIFGIRLEDYRFQRILIIVNLIKIGSALAFFFNGRYDVLGYFIFSQFGSLIAVIAGIIVAKRTLNYDFLFFLKAFKFDREIYNKTNKLAFSALFLTLCWIFYYELDLFVIGKILGSKQVAIYAIGLSIMTLFRTLFGVIFTPFTARFNYFLGLNDKNGIKEFFFKVLILSLPITALPVIAASVTIKSFIFSWVGQNYLESIPIARLLVLGYVFSFISYPSGILLMAFERVRTLFLTSALLPIIYWSGILLTYQYIGLKSFAYFKLLSFGLSAFIYVIIITKLFNVKIVSFFKDIILPAIYPSVTLLIFLYLISDYLPQQKSTWNMITYVIINGFSILGALILYYFNSRKFRAYTDEIFRKIMEKWYLFKTDRRSN